MSNRTISHFELQDLLGEGAMGRVYRAVDLNLDRKVALKLLSDRSLGDPSFLDRFKREARLAAQLNHPHIATIYAFGEENGEAYLAMELVRGITLSGRIKHGALSLEDVRRFGVQIAKALEAAHAVGIVHRDIKTSNLMITEAGDIKVMDFGVSRRMGDTQLTMEGSIVGTANIMAPEVVRGREATPPADLFSLGCVLYECLAGRPAFAGDDPMAVLYQITNEDPPPLTEFRPDVPPDLLEVVNGLLIKDPEKRLGPAAAVAARLSGAPVSTPPPAAAGGAEVTMVLPGGDALRPAPAPAAPERPAAPPAPPARGTGRRSRRNRWWALGIFFTLAAAGVWIVITQGGLEGKPSAADLTRQGEEKVATDPAAAAALFDQAVQTDPDYAPAWNNLGFVSLNRGDAEGARTSFKKAADLGYALAKINLADLEKAGNPAEALKLVEEALDEDPRNPRVHVGAAGILDALDRDDRARGEYAKAIEEGFDHLTPWNNLGSMLIEAGKPDSALLVLDAGLEKFADDPDVHALWRNRGNALLELQEYSAADSAFTLSLDGSPSGDRKAMALAGKARAAEGEGDIEAAKDLWKRMMEEAASPGLQSQAQAAIDRLSG